MPTDVGAAPREGLLKVVLLTGVVALLSVSTPPPTSAVQPLDTAVVTALEHLKAGEIVAAREMMEALVRASTMPPEGAISVWLAAGGSEAQDAHRWTVVDYPGEVRLHVIAAQKARQQGDTARAARHVALALALPLADSLAVSEARALGWNVDDAPPDALPGPDGVTSRGKTWLIVLALLIFGLLLAAWLARSRRELAVVMVSLVVLLLPSPQRGGESPRPELLDLSSSLALGEGCRVLPTVAHDGVARISAMCDAMYRHYSLRSTSGARLQARRDGPGEFDALDHDAVAQLEQLSGDVLVSSTVASAAQQRGWPSEGAAAQLIVTKWVVITALLACLLGVLDVIGMWRHIIRDEPLWIRYALQIAAVLLALHILVDEHLLMSFGVYELNPHIVDATIPRYGPGAVWFYGPVQWLMGADHVWLSRLNRVYGLGCVVLTSGLTFALFGRQVAAAVVALLLMVCAPTILLAHTSESIVVGPTWAFLTGLWFTLRPGKPSPVLAAFSWGAAALSRPEMTAVVALTPVVVWWLRRDERFKALRWDFWVACASLYVLVGAELAWLIERIQSMVISGSLDVARDQSNPILLFLWNLGGVSGPLNIVLNPMFSPTVIAIGLFAAIVDRRTRRVALTLGVLSTVWMALTTVDLTFISIPRLQMPALLLVIPASASGFLSLGFLTRAKRRLALSALLMVGAVVTVALNYPTTNAQVEDRFWRSALASLPDAAGCLVTLRYEDPPDGGRTTRNTPDYLLEARSPAWSVHGTSEAQRVLDTCTGEVYALLGMRCHAQLRRPDEPAPNASEMLEGCRHLHDHFILDPVLEEWVENAGDLDYPMYPHDGPLRLGLYRIVSGRAVPQ